MDTARIAILCPGYGVVARGVETFIEDLIPRLREIKPGWTFDIYCRAPSSQKLPEVRLVNVPAVDRDGRTATLYARLGHRLRIFLRTRIDAECLSFTLAAATKLLPARYDLIFNQAGPFAGNLLRLKRRMDGTPFVHETASGYGRLEHMMTCQRPNAVVATSPYACDWLKERVDGVRIECIPKSVDTVAFRPYSNEEIESAGNGQRTFDLKHPIILFVGAMDPMKRPELLISAMSRIPEASLVMIGDGRLTGSIRQLADEQLGSHRFLHIPQVSRDELPLYYNKCDLLTLPSEEPFGMVFLEAMACDKPVVANKSPVQEWILGDAGTTCDCTDPDAYAQTIRNVLETARPGRARERSMAFAWSEITPMYASLFSQIASSRGEK